jgi:hypothetical protein
MRPALNLRPIAPLKLPRKLLVKLAFSNAGRSALIVAALLIAAPIAGAQVQNGPTDSVSQTEFAGRFFDAVLAARWHDAADMLDVPALESIRRRIANHARIYRATKPVTAQQLMRGSSDMPRAVAVYRAREINDNVRAQAHVTDALGVSGPDSLLALSVHVFGERWLEVQDERWMLREGARRCGHGETNAGPLESYRVLGSVLRDSVAYVLYDPGASRAPAVDPQVPRSPRVMVLRRRGDTWSIIPREGLIGMGDLVNACG